MILLEKVGMTRDRQELHGLTLRQIRNWWIHAFVAVLALLTFFTVCKHVYYGHMPLSTWVVFDRVEAVIPVYEGDTKIHMRSYVHFKKDVDVQFLDNLWCKTIYNNQYVPTHAPIEWRTFKKAKNFLTSSHDWIFFTHVPIGAYECQLHTSTVLHFGGITRTFMVYGKPFPVEPVKIPAP